MSVMTRTPEQSQLLVMPTHVVVDTSDGYTFWGGVDKPFTRDEAFAFANKRNANLNPGVRPYIVCSLKAEVGK